MSSANGRNMGCRYLLPICAIKFKRVAAKANAAKSTKDNGFPTPTVI